METPGGVRTIDPKNARIKQGITSLDNVVEVPGAEFAYQAANLVPHGEIRQVWFQAATLDEPRRLHAAARLFAYWRCIRTNSTP